MGCERVLALKATFEVTLTTPQRLSMKQLGKTHNTTTTSVTISPYATRYTQVAFTFTFTFDFTLNFLMIHVVK